MAMTAAERQQKYRKSRSTSGDNGERRINTWVSTGTALALDRLASHYGLSKREMLERLINQADDKVVKKLESDSPEWNEYFSVTA